jgi:hypothetical protein
MAEVKGSKNRRPRAAARTGTEAGAAAAATVEASRPAGAVSWREQAAWVAIALAIYCLVGTWGQFDFSDLMGYYDAFADALLAGQLHLLLTPQQVNLVDMIPYEGKYYFNWGPFPVIFHLAARAVGLRLTDRVACILAGALSCCLLLRILLVFQARHYPDLPNGWLRWFFFGFGFAAPTALVTMRGTIYNESIGISAALILAAFWSFLRFQESPAARWPLLAGAAIGAAAFTRVTLILYAVPFFLAFAFVDWKRRALTARIAAALAVFSLPVFAAAGLHLAHNNARWGKPLSFGQEFKPESVAKPGGKVIRPYAIAENMRHYLLSTPRFSPDFPWIIHEGWPPVVHVTRAEAMSSLLLGSPFLLLIPFSILIFREQPGDSRDSLRAAAALALGAGCFMFLFGMMLPAASRRYAQDFFPLLTVAAFLGAAELARRNLLDWKRWRVPAWILLLLAAGINIHTPFYQSFQTPTADTNVMRALVAWTPTIQKVLPGPKLNEEAAIAANDLGTLYFRDRRFADALKMFEKAAAWMPESARIQQNLRMARQMAGGR